MKLDQYEITHCTCKKCISYCKIRPGWFRPSEMSRLTEFLEMPLDELFRKYLIADFWIGKSTNIYVLSPIKDFDRVKSEEEQEILTMQREFNKLMDRKACDTAGGYTSWGLHFHSCPMHLSGKWKMQNLCGQAL